MARIAAVSARPFDASCVDGRRLRLVRAVILWDVVLYAVIVVAFGRTLRSWPVVVFLTSAPAALWLIADLAAWDGSRAGVKARVACGAILALALVPLALSVVGRGTYGGDPSDGVRSVVMAVSLASLLGSLVCVGALTGSRGARSSQPTVAGGGAAAFDAGTFGPDPVAEGAARHPARVVPAPRAPRGTAVLAAFGIPWIAGGVVEALRGQGWLGVFAVAAGVGWMLCADTVLDRRTDRRLRRSDRHSFLPVVLVPLGGLALLVRAGWLLLHT